MAFIRPIVPIEIKSSVSFPVLAYFFTIWATSRKFLSINIFFASSSPLEYLSRYSCSSFMDSGLGKELPSEIYEANIINSLTIEGIGNPNKAENIKKRHLPIIGHSKLYDLCWEDVHVYF